MRNIVFTRVDDRLIHGEVVTAWVPAYRINHILVIDDAIASDQFQKRILKSLSPTNVRVTPLSVAQASKYLQENCNEKERILLLSKSPIVYQQLVEQQVQLKAVNLGGMGIRGQRKTFVKNVACDEQEIAAIKDLIAHNVHVFYQLVPEQRVIEVKDLV